MHKILIVDDQKFNHIFLKDVLEDEYEFFDAYSGQEALDIIEEKHEEISLILLDLRMEGINGFDVLERLNEKGYIKRLPVIVMTGDNGEAVETRSLELHASDFLAKPFNTPVIKQRISNVISLNSYQRSLEDKVYAQTEKIRKINLSLLDLLGVIVEYRDSESGNHVYRVKNYTYVMAKALQEKYPEYQLSESDVQNITNASVLHDLGKIAIPDSILLKPGRLTPEEFEIMKTHAAKGGELVSRVKDIWDEDFYDVAFNITRHHHERYDGRGYPDKLEGENIPISAQIVSLADVFDALVSDRVYKKAVSPETAKEMILSNQCGVFSPKILDCFEACFERFKEISENYR